MLTVDENGIVDSDRITVDKKSIANISNDQKLILINGIIVHQTASDTAADTLRGYANPKHKHGAHFLIDLDGTIYQTASLTKTASHVGKLRSRCFINLSCEPSEMIKHGTKDGQYWLGDQVKTSARIEAAKPYPERYPDNTDSIGIEIVGNIRIPERLKKHHETLSEEAKKVNLEKKGVYDTVNASQNSSLIWLMRQLMDTFKDIKEIIPHPTVSRKGGDPKANGEEAHTARPAINAVMQSRPTPTPTPK